MKLTKGIITRDEAIQISPDYVAFVEGDFDKFNVVDKAFSTLSKGQEAISALMDDNLVTFVKVRVTSVNHHDPRSIDGPIIRVSNGEYTWRCDGSKYAFPLAK